MFLKTVQVLVLGLAEDQAAEAPVEVRKDQWCHQAFQEEEVQEEVQEVQVVQIRKNGQDQVS